MLSDREALEITNRAARDDSKPGRQALARRYLRAVEYANEYPSAADYDKAMEAVHTFANYQTGSAA